MCLDVPGCAWMWLDVAGCFLDVDMDVPGYGRMCLDVPRCAWMWIWMCLDCLDVH